MFSTRILCWLPSSFWFSFAAYFEKGEISLVRSYFHMILIIETSLPPKEREKSKTFCWSVGMIFPNIWKVMSSSHVLVTTNQIKRVIFSLQWAAHSVTVESPSDDLMQPCDRGQVSRNGVLGVAAHAPKGWRRSRWAGCTQQGTSSSEPPRVSNSWSLNRHQTW